MRYSWAAVALLPLAAAKLGLGLNRRDVQQPLIDQHGQPDVDPALLYPEHKISVPVDHFPDDSLYEPHSNETFPLRYWFDASHYKEGGPVIILLGGETNGSDRLPFLQKGLLAQLGQATNGIAVVLEHRYYGTSIPTPDLSTANLRFLSTQQALADVAHFAQNIKFPGYEQYDLTSDNAAYITYGGSYAGSMSAFLRVVYPNIIWGAISSSGVPEAIIDYWQYSVPIIEGGPIACIDTQQTLMEIVDSILINKKNDTLKTQLKSVFDMANLTRDDDFSWSVSTGILGWQARNWDPKVSSDDFNNYCDVITNASLVYPGTIELKDEVASLVNASGIIKDYAVTAMLNLIGFTNKYTLSECTANETRDECLSVAHSFEWDEHDLTQNWRLWFYQVCTQWGYFQTGSGVPADRRSLISRGITLEHQSLVCRKAFNISTMPDIDSINQYGGYNISADRLAFIDGEVDPWRPAGVHGFSEGAPQRNSTTNQPFILIPNAVHHWDENGLFDNQTTSALPPRPIKRVQQEEVRFVKAWVEEWHAERKNRREGLE